MSFYSYKNKGNDRSPSLIDFEALRCVTERVCIQVNKVYDSCLQQEAIEDAAIKICCIKGSAPYTFISLSTKTSHAKLENVIITPLDDRPNFSRVQADVVLMLSITYSDSTGTEYVTGGITVIHKDVVLYTPNQSIIPYELEAVVGAVGVSGTISTSCCPECPILTADICVSIILKIVAMVELLIPAFGFCEIPPCEEYSDETCDGFFSLPLFPPQMEDVLSNNTCLGSSFYNSKCDK